MLDSDDDYSDELRQLKLRDELRELKGKLGRLY